MSDSQSADVTVELVPQPHGGAIQRGNPGVRSVLVILRQMARRRLREAIELAGTIINDADADVEDQMRAAEFLRRCTGMDQEKPTPRKRSTFSVVHASAEEQGQKVRDRQLADAIDTPPEPDPAPAKPKSGSGAPL